MKLLIYIIPSALLMLVMGCAALKDHKPDLEGSAYPLTIIQGGNRIEIHAADTTVSLLKKSFTLEFVSRKYDSDKDLYYATQIGATRDVKEFNNTSIGAIPRDHSLFGYARGKSCVENEEYETMYIDNNGHHYIFYGSEDQKRATLSEKLNDDLVRLNWTINSFTENGEATDLKSVESSEFYLLFLQDFNLNDTIEVGELRKLHILID